MHLYRFTTFCGRSSVQFSPNSACLIAGCLDNKIRIWNRIDSQCLQIFTSHLNVKYKIDCLVVLSKKGIPYLLSGSEDGHLYIWNQETTELVSKIKLHEGINTQWFIYCCHFLLDVFMTLSACVTDEGVLVASSGFRKDTSVKLWNINDNTF